MMVPIALQSILLFNWKIAKKQTCLDKNVHTFDKYSPVLTVTFLCAPVQPVHLFLGTVKMKPHVLCLL